MKMTGEKTLRDTLNNCGTEFVAILVPNRSKNGFPKKVSLSVGSKNGSFSIVFAFSCVSRILTGYIGNRDCIIEGFAEVFFAEKMVKINRFSFQKSLEKIFC